MVVERLSRDDARELLATRSRPDVAKLHTEADQIRRRLDILASDLDIDERTLARRDRALRAKLADLESRLADAGRVDVLGPLVAAGDVGKIWDALDVDRRRLVVDTLLTVTILPVKRGTRTFDPHTVRIEPRIQP